MEKANTQTEITGAFFKNWIEKKEIDPQDVADNFGIRLASLRNNYFSSDGLTYNIVRTILVGYPDFPIGNFNYQFSDFGFSKFYTKDDNIKPFRFPPYHKMSLNQFNEEVISYFNSLIELVENTREKIVIYDYLVKGDNEVLRTQTIFQDRQEEYLKAILEKCIENEKIRYSRIIVLPRSHTDNTHQNVENAIPLLLLESFNHILESFKKLGERFDLFFCSEPVKPYSVGCFDRRTIILELHQYINKFAYPHEIFTFKDDGANPNSAISKIVSDEVADIDDMIMKGMSQRDPFKRISSYQLINSTEWYFNKLKDEIRKEQTLFDNLKSINSLEVSNNENNKKKYESIDRIEKLEAELLIAEKKYKLGNDFDLSINSQEEPQPDRIASSNLVNSDLGKKLLDKIGKKEFIGLRELQKHFDELINEILDAEK